ncbi:hypothetical protein JOM56_002967 [Amanita muscaria]
MIIYSSRRATSDLRWQATRGWPHSFGLQYVALHCMGLVLRLRGAMVGVQIFVKTLTSRRPLPWRSSCPTREVCSMYFDRYVVMLAHWPSLPGHFQYDTFGRRYYFANVDFFMALSACSSLRLSDSPSSSSLYSAVLELGVVARAEVPTNQVCQ